MQKNQGTPKKTNSQTTEVGTKKWAIQVVVSLVLGFLASYGVYRLSSHLLENRLRFSVIAYVGYSVVGFACALPLLYLTTRGMRNQNLRGIFILFAAAFYGVIMTEIAQYAVHGWFEMTMETKMGTAGFIMQTFLLFGCINSIIEFIFFRDAPKSTSTPVVTPTKNKTNQG